MVPLQRTPGCWVEELPSVLWSINTTPNRSTGYTPFFMVYGAEAVLPSDIRHDSPRVAAYVEADNEVLDRMLWTDWMKSETWQLPARRFTNRIFVAITVVRSEPE